MKKTLISISLIVIALIVISYLFVNKPTKFDTKPYEVKIDSLQHGIDSIALVNDTLELSIDSLQGENFILVEKTDSLKGKISNLKTSLKQSELSHLYTPSQVDSFFVTRYPEKYTEVSNDTTQLPIQVSKAVIVDLQQSDINKDIVIAQDNVIVNQYQTIQNTNQIVSTLRDKEVNYQSIIQKQNEQGDNYKIQIGGLKSDIKKSDRRIKMGKIQKFVLATLVVGLVISHK
jgi:hypoxanthine-guanine phosphoribosyltransferase